MPGLLRGIAKTAVVAGTASSVSNRVSRRQGKRWAAQDQQAAYQQGYGYGQPPPYQQQPPPYQQPQPYAAPPPAPAADTDSKLAQLRELGELKSQGVLTEAEFEEQKRRILGS